MRLVVVLILILTGCAGISQTVSEDQQSFLEQYQAYCGVTYSGETTYIDLGDNSPFEGAHLTVTFAECTDERVRMPFSVDDDTSRAWRLDRLDEGLRLAHDHRDEAGEEVDANMYGGFADEQGDDMKQFFPADEKTISERPSRDINVWSKSFDHDAEEYTYRLYLDGELRFEARFDLSTPADFTP